MPTKRVRRPQAVRRQPAAALERYMLTGEYGEGPTHGFGNGVWDTFVFSGDLLHGNYDRLRALWAEHGPELLAAWIREHPGTRPFAWWALEAPEPRRVLSGAAHVLPPGPAWWEPVWRSAFGIPPLEQVGPFTVEVESEAAYLRRRDLLGAEERRALRSKHYEPETMTADAGGDGA